MTNKPTEKQIEAAAKVFVRYKTAKSKSLDEWVNNARNAAREALEAAFAVEVNRIKELEMTLDFMWRYIARIKEGACDIDVLWHMPENPYREKPVTNCRMIDEIDVGNVVEEKE